MSLSCSTETAERASSETPGSAPPPPGPTADGGPSAPVAPDTPGVPPVSANTRDADDSSDPTDTSAPSSPVITAPAGSPGPAVDPPPGSSPEVSPSGVPSDTSQETTGIPPSSTTEPEQPPDPEAVGPDAAQPPTDPPMAPAFLLGADISSIPEAVDNGATFIDTDGATKSMIDLLQNHGFNAVRLRTFVNPQAPYGYAQGTGGSCAKAEAYNDATHTAEFGAEVKAAGMQLLVDFHYSDTWADPGKQIIPEAWRNATTIDDLANHVRVYTTDTLNQLIAAGARPDMVQVGNETTPGMLIHVPSSQTDCWGNNSDVRSGVTGRATNDNWDNLATLLRAGVEAVRTVDPTIEVVLHIENTDDLEGVRWWVDNAVSREVDFDILGLSAYTAFQGQPSVWRTTLQTMAEEFPGLDFMLVEYNPERTQANRVVNDLPDGRGRGTFFWEPTQSGSWGESMFTQNGNTFTAKPQDFAEYDVLLSELGL